MRDPIQIGDAWIDRAQVTAVVPLPGKVLIFLRGGRPIVLSDTFSREELRQLAAVTRPERTETRGRE